MTTWLPPVITAAAITATYILCIRPHQRGRGRTARSSSEVGLDRQLAALREELRVLRAQDALDAGQVPTRAPNPPTGY